MNSFLLIAAMFLFASRAVGQQEHTDLLQRSSQHEKQAMESRSTFQFAERTEFQTGSETRVVVETTEGRMTASLRSMISLLIQFMKRKNKQG